MPRFALRKGRADAANLAGAQAFSLTPEFEFAMILLTSFAQDQFYRGSNQTFDRLMKLLSEVEPQFAAKAALFARNEFGMRSITHVVGAELPYRTRGHQWMRPFVASLCRRPDDAMEILARAMTVRGKRKIPNALKDGIALAFDKWDGYQIAKYRGEDREPSLVDVVNLVHPKPNERNSEALAMLVRDELRSTETWEARLSAAGELESEEEVEERRAAEWAELVRKGRAHEKGGIGYFALLRNLRNILEQAPEAVEDACSMLADEALIRQSLVLPFRFATAAKELEEVPGSQQLLSAVSDALDISVQNVPEFPGRTLVAIDVSGSMTGTYNRRSPIEQAAVFGASIALRNRADVLLFDTETQSVSLSPRTPVLEATQKIRQKATGGGTDFRLIFGVKKAYERIVILSDMQPWVGTGAPLGELRDYCKRTGASPKIYSFDLAGYGTAAFPAERIYALAGFSEKVFDLMKLLEDDPQALIHRIDAVEIQRAG